MTAQKRIEATPRRSRTLLIPGKKAPRPCPAEPSGTFHRLFPHRMRLLHSTGKNAAATRFSAGTCCEKRRSTPRHSLSCPARRVQPLPRPLILTEKKPCPGNSRGRERVHRKHRLWQQQAKKREEHIFMLKKSGLTFFPCGRNGRNLYPGGSHVPILPSFFSLPSFSS